MIDLLNSTLYKQEKVVRKKTGFVDKLHFVKSWLEREKGLKIGLTEAL